MKTLGEGKTIIDLFAGIGGIRLGFEHWGCKTVFSSEIDPHAAKMYEENFGELPFGDINGISASEKQVLRTFYSGDRRYL